MASNLEEIWRRKSDDEVSAAAHRLEEYSEDGQRVIRAELARRQTPEYAASVEEMARRVEQEEHEFDASPAGIVSRRISLAVVVLTIPLIGVAVAAGVQAVSRPDVPEISTALLLNRLAIASALAGVALIVVIAVAGQLARGSRHRVLLIFKPGLSVASIVVAGLLISHGVILVMSIYLMRSGAAAIWPVTAAAFAGVVAILRNLSSAVTPVEARVMGRSLTRHDSPRLWKVIDDTAERLSALKPEHVVVGLDPAFFVTEANVITPAGRLIGRTLYSSLAMARILTREEWVAVIGHELAHFRGDDTRFSQRFYPIYRGVSASIASLQHASRGFAALALMPAMAMLGFFLEAFAVAERALARERELAADRAGAEVTSPRVVAAALVKAHAYHRFWADVQRDAVARITAGLPPANIAMTYATLVAGRADVKVLSGIAAGHLSHPTDTHPALAARLESLAVSLDSVAEDALRVVPVEPAIGLVDAAESHERQLSAAYCSALAANLGLVFDAPREMGAAGVRRNTIQRCQTCGMKVLPTAAGACPSCGAALAP